MPTSNRILIGCEFSGIVREAFGEGAVSCDLLPTEIPGEHIQGDILEVAYTQPWDLAIFFPPCTHLCASGARWFKNKKLEQNAAVEFVSKLLNAPIPRIALENPVGVLSTRIRKPDQIIQPWMFSHPESKATCLWLKGLPLLKPTGIVEGRFGRVHQEPPSANRWKNRSRTYTGIAKAMAEQWK